MKRRDVLKTALLGGGAALAGEAHAARPKPAVSAAASAASSAETARPGAWKPLLFDEHQNQTVITLSDLVIPATDTPGAKESRVNEYIDLISHDGSCPRRGLHNVKAHGFSRGWRNPCERALEGRYSMPHSLADLLVHVVFSTKGRAHVHMLLAAPTTACLADLMRFVKGSSSRWVHQEFPAKRSFGWQRGFAAFSVSRSRFRDVYRYIEHQEEHHKKVSFQEELVAFLKRHQIEYDERYVWS